MRIKNLIETFWNLKRPITFGGNSEMVWKLYQIFPNVELPPYEIVGPRFNGLLNQFKMAGIKFLYKKGWYGKTILLREDQLFTSSFEMGVAFREFLLHELCLKMEAELPKWMYINE